MQKNWPMPSHKMSDKSMIDQITRILNDPDSMNQITELASAFGLEQNATQSIDSPKGLTGELGNIFQNFKEIPCNSNDFKEKDAKQQALMQALLPYLKPNRRIKLERALQVATISQLANTALRTELQKTSTKEETYDV